MSNEIDTSTWGPPPEGYDQWPTPSSEYEAEWPFNKNCYRDRTVGNYQTLLAWEAWVTGGKVVKVHGGPCTTCEGQAYPDCVEPGDQEVVR